MIRTPNGFVNTAKPQSAFVTGASAGIGRSIARRLLAEGVRVWGTARTADRLTELATNERFMPVELDLGNGAKATDAYRAAVESSGGFDLVVNNAGYGHFEKFAQADFGDWERQLDAMLIGTARLAHAQLRDLQKRGRGTLVNVSSLATEFPLPFMSGYNMAKAGLSALSESLLIETRGTDVTVIDFRPGDYRTGFNQAMTSPPASPTQSQMTLAWASLEKNLAEAPLPEKAAKDLWRAVLRGRKGIVRSGGIFQAVLAPLFERLVPETLARKVRWYYFGLR